ncbi:MAG: B12-binding domain-containing radical SAM protein [Candidatus Omnitrophica bacterium]|nr:B12-binding domain-containing radical SAM protein [Candidatus Omnitrophota bacterium]
MPLILLINPKFRKDLQPCPQNIAAREPLSILALGSYIKKIDLEVKLIDVVLYKEEHISGLISNIITNEPKPILIGFSVMTAQVSHALHLSDLVRSIDKSIPIVWGGVHPTLFPKETSLDGSVDIVVHGRGEAPLFTICEQLMTKGRIAGDIPGTCVKGKFNAPEKNIEMIDYPYLDYELLDLKRYLGPFPHFLSDKPNRALNIISARGCPWRCAFCINKATDNQWTPLGHERYLDELSINIKRYNLDAYRVIDEDFFFSKGRASEIITGLKKREITKEWGTNIKASYFRDDYISLDFAKNLKSTGCKFFNIGAESGNQRILDLITKDITVEQIIHSAEVCSQADIIPIYSWMIGIPTQSKKEIFDTIEIMIQISRICPPAIHYSFSIFRPYPGSGLYDLCIKNGLRVPRALRDWAGMITDENIEHGNVHTGYYKIENLPWIKEEKFIEFLAKYAHIIPGILSKSIKVKIKASLVYIVVTKWDALLAKIIVILIELRAQVIKIIRRPFSI